MLVVNEEIDIYAGQELYSISALRLVYEALWKEYWFPFWKCCLSSSPGKEGSMKKIQYEWL